MSACVLSRFNPVWFFATLWTVAHQAPLSLGFSRQEYWGGFPCTPSGNLPDPGIKPMSLMSLALVYRFFTTSTTGKLRTMSVCVLVTQLCPTLWDPWTVAHQAPLSMGFSGKNTGLGCHFLLQGIFSIKESNLDLLYCRQILYTLSHQGSHSN